MSDTVKAIILDPRLSPSDVRYLQHYWGAKGVEVVELCSAYLENTAPSGQTFMGFWSGDHTFHGQGPFLVGEWKKVDDE